MMIMNAEENFLFYTYSENRNNCLYPMSLCSKIGYDTLKAQSNLLCVQTYSSTYDFYICIYTECYQIWPSFLNS